MSYYGKGALITLCLDLHIRSRTAGRRSLDDVMRALWRRYGRSGLGVPEDGVERVAEEASGLKLRPLFDRWLRGTAELPLAELLGTVGVELEVRRPKTAPIAAVSRPRNRPPRSRREWPWARGPRARTAR